MTPTPNPTAEQIVADAITAYWADEERSGPNRGPLAHDFACGEAATAALRAAGLLSEGAPTEAQIERAAAARALTAFADDYEDIYADSEKDMQAASMDYWRGADDAVKHAMQKVRARVAEIRERES